MIDIAVIGEIIRTYAKHGWILRRVLLTAKVRRLLGDETSEVFGDAHVVESDIDAAWFSRPPKTGEVAWEIRHLSETPFALLEYVDESSNEFEDKLHEVESRLTKSVAANETLDNAMREHQT